jgi:hypothetical protein
MTEKLYPFDVELPEAREEAKSFKDSAGAEHLAVGLLVGGHPGALAHVRIATNHLRNRLDND